MTPCVDHWHRKYHLTCDQFAALKAFTSGLCHICGMKERYTPSGFHIDHDHELGMWAVRGLLCPRCNTLVEIPGKLVGPEMDDYRASPWHVRAGLAPKPPGWVPAAAPGRSPEVASVAELGDRESCLAELRQRGAEFIKMRGPRSRSTNEARGFALNHLRPLVVQAKALGIATATVAAATGYTPETINAIWSRQRAKRA